MRGIVEQLRNWAQRKPDAPAVAILDNDGEPLQRLTFGELDLAACRMAAVLGDIGAAPVLLPAEASLDFVVALCGCLYAGTVATPVPASARPPGLARLRGIIADAGISHAIATGGASAELSRALEGLSWIAPAPAGDATAPRGLQPAHPALLQYTSGSTEAPKGVVVTLRNLEANLGMLAEAFEAGEDSRVLSWLPLHHDMGLIGQLLLSLACGAVFHAMRPTAFVRQPRRWLSAVGRHAITISGAPNFAYELCTRRVSEVLAEDLDLSRWRVAYCGAEPVRLATLHRFAETFAPSGFDPKALLPCYGLAEATVFVSGGPAGTGVRTLADVAGPQSPGSERVGCGQVFGNVAIVDPLERRRVADGEGEIWVAGDHVAAGYWNRGDPDTFGAEIEGEAGGRYLRTGDLGLVHGGELFVTGRLKSLIIHRGANLHPEDIEATVAGSDRRFGAMGAAFAVEAKGEEQVAAAFEIARGASEQDVEAMIGIALAAVADTHGVRLYDLVLVASGALPRTTSGKIQRALCQQLYTAGQLKPIGGGRLRSLGVNQPVLEL